jgi:hypothetical protein
MVRIRCFPRLRQRVVDEGVLLAHQQRLELVEVVVAATMLQPLAAQAIHHLPPQAKVAMVGQA